ncbi:MAG: NADH-quinone oxidoreductase subunit C [Firmicutes bacterium]|nr:NADH-quinone oxidoreductase subunit C [Alicyclobacillaceae bacterium]MCL6497504.1 NADH-quinone oxidoreductase subunit C [Bacillota bacterium]
MIGDAGVVERLKARHPEAVEPMPAVDQPTVRVPKSVLLAVARYLHDEEGYRLLIDVAGVDYLPERPRFEVVYHLLNPDTRARLRVKCRVDEDEAVPSVTEVWPGADWPEREAYDLFGIRFEGHPHLTRIYMPDDWEGHPLRKDYPLRGPRID